MRSMLSVRGVSKQPSTAARWAEGLSVKAFRVLAGHLYSSGLCAAQFDFQEGHSACSLCLVHLLWPAAAVYCLVLQAPGVQSGRLHAQTPSHAILHVLLRQSMSETIRGCRCNHSSALDVIVLQFAS